MENNVYALKQKTVSDFPDELENLSIDEIHYLIVGLKHEIRAGDVRVADFIKTNHSIVHAENIRDEFVAYGRKLTRTSDEIEDRLDAPKVDQAAVLRKLEKLCDRQITRNDKIIAVLDKDIQKIKEKETKAFEDNLKKAMFMVGFPVTSTSLAALFYGQEPNIAVATAGLTVCIGTCLSFPKEAKKLGRKIKGFPTDISYATIRSVQALYVVNAVRQTSFASVIATQIATTKLSTDAEQSEGKRPEPIKQNWTPPKQAL
jgi:hypothetical protein